MYKSKLGEILSYEQWARWADEFYEALPKAWVVVDGKKTLVHIKKPDDWFKRVSKVLKLEKIESDEV